ncbi:hypothetical protein HS1genome_0200 [Sulfodiicoccus acidiphilus]|uniref:DUF2175 domain-containing protein n=1 Tax=Sulfodiicoccus acidiphilus TaxID=1670455 RepID=A0A348B0V9_9CREN|nr:DUF2175 family protein [Sulfodiicoccus acidiphilus]BBD71811.1 hypothetical protein HS1genome_0200 [Sulfodiicoccus acidiphilus]GGT99333.1 hypothetical protein GCM10007116_15930 [Sulfodiicoccus acidiphilus]
MSKSYTKWKCGFCENQIAWEEPFTYMSNKTVVHFTCLKDRALRTPKGDQETLRAVLDSLEEELTSIQNYKARLSKITNDEVRKVLDQAEKDAEKNAGILTRMIEKLSNVLES